MVRRWSGVSSSHDDPGQGVPSFDATTDGHTDLEPSVHVDMRWWTLADLEIQRPTVAPARLASLLRDLLASGPPAEPFDCGV